MKNRANNLSLEGLNDLRDALDMFTAKEADSILGKTIRLVLARALKEIKAAVPVDTGLLKSKLRVKKYKKRRGETNAVYGITTDGKAPHWTLLEYGTQRMPARPFIRPVRDRYRIEMPQQLQSAFDESLKKHMKKMMKKRGGTL